MAKPTTTSEIALVRPRIDPSCLEIRLLDESAVGDAHGFSCGDADLDDFLRVDALRLHDRQIVRTYVAYHEDELMGFVALMNDAIVLETKERKSLTLDHRDHPVIPALKIARLGVGASFRRAFRGGGDALVQFAWATARHWSDQVGCRLLTVDAYEGSIAFYERLGFIRNRAREYRERTHPSMRLDIRAPRPSWLNVPAPPSEADEEGPSDA